MTLGRRKGMRISLVHIKKKHFLKDETLPLKENIRTHGHGQQGGDYWGEGCIRGINGN